MQLSQSEADFLIALEKERSSDDYWDYPQLGGKISIPLVARDGRESFFLDLSRSKIRLSKMKFQNRARHAIPLVRLDIDGPPHRNPDGVEVECPHLHVYREGFAMKWALPVPGSFTDLTDTRVIFEEFNGYCNVVLPPIVDFGLFT